jgi:hypothetical protein
MSTAETPDSTPATARPPNVAGVVHGLVQLAGLTVLVVGLVVLVGWAATCVIVGPIVLVGSLVLEYLATRPPRPLGGPTVPGGDR